MARSNYNTILTSPSGGDLSNPAYNGYLKVANYGTNVPPSSSGYGFQSGVYTVLSTFSIDSENVTFLSPVQANINIGNPTYGATASFNLTGIYSGINWSVSRTDLLEIKAFQDGSNAIMIRAIVNTIPANSAVGTLTVSGSCDGNNFSVTVNLFSWDSVITGIPYNAYVNINSYNGGYINNLAYRKNGGSWTGMNTVSGGGYAPVQFISTDQMEFQALFSPTGGASLVYGQINANGNYSSETGSSLTLSSDPTQSGSDYTVYFYSENNFS